MIFTLQMLKFEWKKLLIKEGEVYCNNERRKQGS